MLMSNLDMSNIFKVKKKSSYVKCIQSKKIKKSTHLEQKT